MSNLLRLLQAAREFTAAGISVIAVRPDGSKAAQRPWAEYQTRLPNGEELVEWFSVPAGLAVVCGAVSGNLEVLDFDIRDLFGEFERECVEQGVGDVLNRCPLVETPSGCRHLYYRSEEPVGPRQILARIVVDEKPQVAIETRAEGCYGIAPPSPAACHPDNRPYRVLRGRPTEPPTLAVAERAALLDIARSFNAYTEPNRIVRGETPRAGLKGVSGSRPGDDFNRRGDPLALLERVGWTVVGRRGDVVLLRRPGKAHGISATLGYGADGLFHPFSTNAEPFEPDRSYSPFAVYALLNRSGDFSSAAAALAAEGYGETDARQGDNPVSVGDASVGNEDWEAPIPFSGHGLPAFPVEVLPGVIGDFVSDVALCSQVPVDMPAMLALSVLSAGVSRRCRIQIGRTHSEPTNLYVCVVMESGSRKSATLEALVKPLRDAEQTLGQTVTAEISTLREQRAIQDRRVAYLRERAAKSRSPEDRQKYAAEVSEVVSELVIVPEWPRLLVDDVTPERLAAIMAEQAGVISMFSAEGGVFGILAGRYSDGRANLDLFLKGHSGDDYRYDRQKGPALHIPSCCLTMGLTVQSDVLSSFSDSPAFRGRGLLGRFLFSVPEDLVGTRIYQDRHPDVSAACAYEAAVGALLTIPHVDPRNPITRHMLHLDAAALSLWTEYANDVERRQGAGGDLSGMRDWGSKLAGEAARIAACLHLANHARDGSRWVSPVSERTIAAAWSIAEYLIPHAQCAYGHMGADPAIAVARRILRWIERLDFEEFSLRECHQAHRSIPKSADLVEGLTILCERSYLRLKAAPASGPKGGRPPSQFYEVNPSVRRTGPGGLLI